MLRTASQCGPISSVVYDNEYFSSFEAVWRRTLHDWPNLLAHNQGCSCWRVGCLTRVDVLPLTYPSPLAKRIQQRRFPCALAKSVDSVCHTFELYSEIRYKHFWSGTRGFDCKNALPTIPSLIIWSKGTGNKEQWIVYRNLKFRKERSSLTSTVIVPG